MLVILTGAVIAIMGLSLVETVDAQAKEPMLGTWKMNVTKSKLDGPTPRSEVRTYVVAAQGIKATKKGVDSAGKPYLQEWMISYDGQDRQITNPAADSVSRRMIDPYTAEYTLKKAGKVVTVGRRSISKDGMTMIITAKGSNAKGEPIDTIEVFERQ